MTDYNPPDDELRVIANKHDRGCTPCAAARLDIRDLACLVLREREEFAKALVEAWDKGARSGAASPTIMTRNPYRAAQAEAALARVAAYAAQHADWCAKGCTVPEDRCDETCNCESGAILAALHGTEQPLGTGHRAAIAGDGLPSPAAPADPLTEAKIAHALAAARANTAFMNRLTERIEADRDLLDRLAGDPPAAPAEIHKPFTDDGITYCGWDKHEGCGELWPCSTVRAAGAPALPLDGVSTDPHLWSDGSNPAAPGGG